MKILKSRRKSSLYIGKTFSKLILLKYIVYPAEMAWFERNMFHYMIMWNKNIIHIKLKHEDKKKQGWIDFPHSFFVIKLLKIFPVYRYYQMTNEPGNSPSVDLVSRTVPMYLSTLSLTHQLCQFLMKYSWMLQPWETCNGTENAGASYHMIVIKQPILMLNFLPNTCNRHLMQGSFCVCVHPTRDDVTLQHRLPMAGHIHKI